MIIQKGTSIYIAPSTKYLDHLEIGHCSIIGDFEDTTNPIVIGRNLKIGSFCKISKNVTIGNDCVIEDTCLIEHSVTIGNNVRLISGCRLLSRSKIGSGSIINSIVSNNVVIEENVRFFGRVAHSHYNHTLDWKTTSEPSPIFRKGCIVGINSLIIGEIEIGENSYVAAGEIVRCNIPPESVYYKGRIYEKKYFRGIII